MIIPWIYFLKEDEQLLVEGLTRRWTVNGPKVFFSRPGWRLRRRKGTILGPGEYLRIRDTLTGELRNELGPKLYLLTATEEAIETLSAITLQNNQYIRIVDRSNGAIRVERGEGAVYLNPTEQVLEGVREGTNIDEHTAVLLRDTRTGELELISTPQVFFPAPNQEIVEVLELIVLENHQTVVIKDRSGAYIFKRGTDRDRAFFLEPHSELVQFCWSSGIYKDRRDLFLTHIDGRPRFMWYDFETRTQDNVELIVGITFFWQILEMESLVRTTDDPTGDVCSHARSVIIQSISKVTLEQFLAEFNSIVRQAVLGNEDNFYGERGLRIHGVEVRSIGCKDPNTQQILLEIIQETTNRLNMLQKQEGENEVKLKQMQGEIQAEALKGELIELRRQHAQAEALTAGEAEAIKVKAFFEGLGDNLDPADKLAIFNTLRKQDALEALSAGNAQLYFTPDDVDLTIEARKNNSFDISCDAFKLDSPNLSF